MSPRAQRVVDPRRVAPFTFAALDEHVAGGHIIPPVRSGHVRLVSRGAELPSALPALARSPAPPGGSGDSGSAIADSESQAFNNGYAQGERAGLELASRQLTALRDRLGQTLDDLNGLREELTRRTEHQVVDLAIAVAARILHREVSLDRELLLVMARLALERLADATAATIHLHPEDERAARGARTEWPTGAIAVVADTSLRPGACVVRTIAGAIDVGVDAQLKEVTAALLGERSQAPETRLCDE